MLCQLEIAKVIAERDICKGLDHVLQNLSDVTLDVPDAPEVLGKFIARAVADDCIPPRYVGQHPPAAEALGQRSLQRAQDLLSMPNAIARLDHVSTVGGGGATGVGTEEKK